jgi:hypothetical protein
MLQPTIYIPSRLAKQLNPLSFPKREVLPALAEMFSMTDACRSTAEADTFRANRRTCCCPAA